MAKANTKNLELSILKGTKVKSALPILGHVVVGQVVGDHYSYVYANTLDYDVELRTEKQKFWDKHAHTEGSVVLIPRTVAIEQIGVPYDVDGQAATFSHNGSVQQVPLKPIGEYPMHPELGDAKQCLTMPVETLVSILKYLLPAVSTDKTRIHLCGVYLEYGDGRVTYYGTDSHMLLKSGCAVGYEAGMDTSVTAILELTMLRQILRLPAYYKQGHEVKLYIHESHVRVSLDYEDCTLDITSLQIEGPYPDIHQVLRATTFSHITMDVESFKAAIMACVPTAKKMETPQVILEFKDGHLTITSKHQASRSKSTVQANGDQIPRCSFNPHMLLKAISGIEGQVRLYVDDPGKAGVIVPETEPSALDEHGRYALLMPLRIKEGE